MKTANLHGSLGTQIAFILGESWDLGIFATHTLAKLVSTFLFTAIRHYSLVTNLSRACNWTVQEK